MKSQRQIICEVFIEKFNNSNVPFFGYELEEEDNEADTLKFSFSRTVPSTVELMDIVQLVLSKHGIWNRIVYNEKSISLIARYETGADDFDEPLDNDISSLIPEGPGSWCD